jgi:hypothetical protein
MANIAAKWPLTIMYALMCFQITVLRERFLTDITEKWPLPAMYA